MPDLLRKSLALHDAVLVAVYWGIVLWIPSMIAHPNLRLRLLGWSLAAGFVGYCAYTGMAAFRRGKKPLFVVHIVIPVALFVMGWVVAAVVSLR